MILCLTLELAQLKHELEAARHAKEYVVVEVEKIVEVVVEKRVEVHHRIGVGARASGIPPGLEERRPACHQHVLDEVALEAGVKQNGDSFDYAALERKADREVVPEAGVKQNGDSLECAALSARQTMRSCSKQA